MSREKDWKYWCDTEFPEEEDIPSGLEKGLSIFRKLLLIRSWCPDRTLSQARKYIADSLGLEFLENKVSQGRNSYLQVYLSHQVLDLDELVQEEEKKAPLICLLTTGSDPCSQVEGIKIHLAY